MPAVDARTTGTQTFASGAFTAGAAFVAFSHTLGAGLQNPYLVVAGAQDANANSTGTNWDNLGTPQALIRKGGAVTGSCRSEIWGVAAPTGSGTKQVRIDWSGTHDGAFGAVSYTGVHQTVPWNAASPQTNTAANGTSIALGATTLPGEMAVSAIVQDYAGSTGTLPAKDAGSSYISAGQCSASSIGVGASDQAATTTTTTFTWTVPNNGGLAIVVASLAAAPSSYVQRVNLRPYPFAPGVPNR